MADSKALVVKEPKKLAPRPPTPETSNWTPPYLTRVVNVAAGSYAAYIKDSQIRDYVDGFDLRELLELAADLERLHAFVDRIKEQMAVSAELRRS